ncbi:hypothetical protein BDW22DRAFT_1329401 [Trametopsis cervina]|nr:hypothetical protein BDW22DRAFT_1329401 [Trametopsis cervina]
MSDTPTLGTLTGLLRNSKIRERQQGIAQLRTVFATERAVLAVDVKKGWFVIFEALFDAFWKEREACSDKGLLHTTPSGVGAALVRRLGEAASAVRWLVEKAVHRFNKNTRELVLDHLYSNIRHRGRLIEHISLDYVKAIKCILNWGPHLDHLEPDTWIKLADFSFNVILEQPLKTSMVPPAEDDSIMQGIETPDEQAETSDAAVPPRKKRRIEQAQTSTPSTSSTPKFLPVTLEKIEFVSLLAILLRSPSAPIVSQHYPYLPAGILRSLTQFLEKYPSDTSLNHDYLTALSATLSQITLNKRDVTVQFAKAAWPRLVAMWGPKNQRLKEDLVVVLRILFPYLVHGLKGSTDDGGLSTLRDLLEGEAQSRWGVPTLSLESLRLVVSSEASDSVSKAFVAKTFQYGWDFDADQALAWAMLELHADCAKQLYAFSESPHAVVEQNSRDKKVTDPIESLLASIRSQGTANARIPYFQALLFFIDRHWSFLHENLRPQVIRTLTQYLSYDDPSTQSWSFICLGAIAHAEAIASPGKIAESVPADSSDNPWDTVWTFAMRRSSVPAVCRAACHAAQILLLHGKTLLNPPRLLAEIENLAKDLDVQGPSFPYDSVCGFLILCMQVASQDISLYRMQLEDKILTWLVDNWRPSGSVRKMPSYTIDDLLKLLASICCLGQKPDIVCDVSLPDCSIVAATKEDAASSVIRDFSLHARLPSFRKPTGITGTKPTTSRVDHGELQQPRGRERRISSFFLKLLEGIVHDWDSQKDIVSLPTAERVRSTLDVSVLALCFEGILLVNGVQWTRRVIQAACKVITQTLPLFLDLRWTLNERSLILGGLSPLYLDGPRKDDQKPWETLLPPGDMTGIRTQVLRSLITEEPSPEEKAQTSRRVLQRALFRMTDVQDISTSVLDTLRQLLKSTVAQLPGTENHNSQGEDRNDGFSTLRISRESSPSSRPKSSSSIFRSIIDTCIASLAILPLLHHGEPTRDKRLIDWAVESSDETLLVILPSLLHQVRQRTLYLSTSSLAVLLSRLGDELLPSYNYSWNEEIRIVIIQLLQSTMHIWLDPTHVNSEVGENARYLGAWLSNLLSQSLGEQSSKLLPWRSRDLIITFLDEYLACDPSQGAWMQEENAEDTMWTRFMCLGNLMIVSSAVRRGPYWHLLEASLFSTSLAEHLEAVLQGVATRMGMADCSVLFEIYGSQIAYSIRQIPKSFMGIPPRLLGFDNPRTYAERAFPAFTPMHIVAGGSDRESVAEGRRLFTDHCRIIQKDPTEGMLECLPELVGYQIVFWVNENTNLFPHDYNELDDILKPKLKELYETGIFDQQLRQQADGVVTAILRTLNDQDFSSDGPIIQALAAHSQSAAQVFEELSTLRKRDRDAHESNLPAFNTVVVLRALDWFNHRVPHAEDTAITYHVLHRLFAALDATLLVNEQLRLLNALCLWIAYHHDHFKDVALLHTLLNGATSIVTQVDLAQDAQSILHWALNRLTSLSLSDTYSQDTRLTELLLRTACTAHDYAKNPAQDIATIGTSMLHWLEDEVITLSKAKTLRSTVRKAVLLWPRTYPQKLREIVGESSLRQLQDVLYDDRISSNKFRVVRQIYQLAEMEMYEEESFARRDFWRLKQYIPQADLLSSEDMTTFISLLVKQRGRVDGLNRDSTPRQSACYKYVFQNRRQPSLDKTLVARQAIISSLFAVLDDPSISQAHLAFRTLRALVAVTVVDQAGSSGWPTKYHHELQLLRAYAQPFKPRQTPDLDRLLQDENPVQTSQDYTRWITHFATSVSDVLAIHDPFYGPLSLILQVESHFAEEVLPILVHTLLQTTVSQPRPRKIISEYASNLLRSSNTTSSCRKVLVDIVLHLREWMPSQSKDPLAYDKWLDIDFILLSQNAVVYGAYTTALLFLELASEYTEPSGIDVQAKEEILYQIYSRIDEPDGFYAIATEDVHGLLIKRLHHEQQWDKAFQFHGAVLETHDADPEGTNGVLQALRAFGFDSLAMRTLQSMPGADSVVDTSMTYQLGWRAGVWDLPQVHDSDDISASQYVALRAIHRERDPEVIDSVIQAQLLRQMDHLKRLGHENLVEIRQVSQVLMCLNEVQRWRKAVLQESPHSETSVEEAFTDTSSPFEFSDLEATLATRISLLHSARAQEERAQIGTMITPRLQKIKDTETNCLLELSRAARTAGHPQVAINSIVKAQKLNGREHFEVACEFANVLWLTKEPKIATDFLKGLLTSSLLSKSEKASTSRAGLLALMGNWASQACLEKPSDIKIHYFDASISPESQTASHVDPSVYHEYATFAERQYHAIAKSPDVLRLKYYINRKTSEIDAREKDLAKLKRSGHRSGHQESEKRKAQTMLNADLALYNEHLNARKMFLEQAIEMYSLCLASTDAFDDDGAIRLCSLWFANFDTTDKDLPLKIGTAVAQIPSHKFVFLAHQLSARLSDDNGQSHNQSNLRNVIFRMCREHPFHALFPVYCLQPGEHSAESRGPSAQDQPNSQALRASAAASIVSRLRSDLSCAKRVGAVLLVCNASLEWAKFPIKRMASTAPKKKTFDIPKQVAIRKLENVEVPVITRHTPLDPTTRYENNVWIKAYESTFDIAGGVNLPKICRCVGSDGKKYKQLFKGEGNDDIRQDAVMEQVFDLVNVVLRHDRETIRRNLRIRGYRVIPLAAQAGVLEFVENTMPLQAWIPKAHLQYRPSDIKPPDFYKQMVELRDSYGTPDNVNSDAMAAKFRELRKRFKPVMRHYFTERTRDPSSWFRMRLCYARSVATTSIVGHVIGLGDRHLSNILLDNDNGEIVHIDLGIAFEQGTLLPVKERVPFRLTADMVDGLGTTGTQGVFQRCAEETLRVLRERSDVILTVLEVFKHDPLHSWLARDAEESKQPDEAGEVLKHFFGFNVNTSTGIDEAADRALNAVTRKLDKSLSVEFTVNELIAEATDEVNLSNMYMGWSPHF